MTFERRQVEENMKIEPEDEDEDDFPLTSGVDGSGLEPMKRFNWPIFSRKVSLRGIDGVDGFTKTIQHKT